MNKIPNQTDYHDLSEWLSNVEFNLVQSGYRRYVQKLDHEDFAYWKTFYEEDNKKYQVGLLFYDYRKYISRIPYSNKISIQYKCILLGGDRIDLSVSKDIDLPEFESMAEIFYQTFKNHI